jgi:hypothetical protein
MMIALEAANDDTCALLCSDHQSSHIGSLNFSPVATKVYSNTFLPLSKMAMFFLQKHGITPILGWFVWLCFFLSPYDAM